MIITERGRSRSRRTEEEIVDILSEELNTLSPAEADVLRILIRQRGSLQQGAVLDKPDLFAVMQTLDYERVPVDLETFVMDPYYLGNTCDNT